MRRLETKAQKARLNGAIDQGEITLPYRMMVKGFGEPTSGDVSNCEWWLEFDDDTACLLYNADPKLQPEEVTEWTIKSIVNGDKIQYWFRGYMRDGCGRNDQNRQ